MTKQALTICSAALLDSDILVPMTHGSEMQPQGDKSGCPGRCESFWHDAYSAARTASSMLTASAVRS